MTGIVLSASVRQNLLSLQSTASLLATTQNDLATGNKVNSALDNPTNYFTAQALNNRASDIGNLLDSIGNGVQVLQAANTGITSLQSLVASAQSIANQVLQAPALYSQLSSATLKLSGTAGTTAAAAGTAADLTNIGSGTANSLAQTLTFTTAAGTKTITLGSGTGDVNTITDLNSALLADNLGLTASLNSDGSITLTSTNSDPGQTLSTAVTTPLTANNIAITSTGGGATLVTPPGGSAGQPLVNASSQATRTSLLNQYNNVIQQIDATAQDSSFNGINLLNGDKLNLTFDESGNSKLSISGVTFNAAGLGLSQLNATDDFQNNDSANAVLTQLTQASTTLRTEASALGSNLSIVQIRQDFNKNLINVLQTGSSNLTLADSNEEAANSQALSTRQSIAVSALALANQSQQSVLQLLR